ncbi:MAG: glycosyltransferase family 4 protein [Chitinophagaceae bacterium]
MNIGFDAKRYFHNNTGLGNYSRTLVNGLAFFFPEHEYFLFNPKVSNQYKAPALPHVYEIMPQLKMDRLFSSFWRSNRVIKDVKQNNISLYHGLSHEIPVGIQQSGIKSIVTIHDLIFERYPKQFNPIDVKIYRKKFMYASRHANAIIAISKQTKNDLVEFYGVEEKKIYTCYQSCDPAFTKQITAEVKESIRHKYNLPPEYFLYVGSIIERKNLLGICKALAITKTDVPLVVIGDGKKYKQQVKNFIVAAGLEKKVIFLLEMEVVIKDSMFQNAETFAAIYQMASALIYPSFFEGFGIPVLEGLASGIPVITSNTSCLPETGGLAAFYVNPANANEIAEAMEKVCVDDLLREKMIKDGLLHAQNFTLQKCTGSVMDVYKSLF